MAVEPFDVYLTIAEIAAAFAGFGSLASALGKKRGGDDARMDAYRLKHMLEASLSATLFSLLPAMLAGLLPDLSWGLRVSAVLAALAILVYAPLAAWDARELRHVAGFSMRATIINSLCVSFAFVVFVLCAIGFPANRAADLYLAGLMGLLASSIMLFSRVIVSMLRPHQELQE